MQRTSSVRSSRGLIANTHRKKAENKRLLDVLRPVKVNYTEDLTKRSDLSAMLGKRFCLRAISA